VPVVRIGRTFNTGGRLMDDVRNRLSRRSVLAGAAGAAAIPPLGLLARRLGFLSLDGSAAAAATCVVAPDVTQGPYWVDEMLNRSDVRANADGSNVQPGVVLGLTVQVVDMNSSCDASGTAPPIADAQVGIWHANAQGMYSAETQQGDNPSVDTSGDAFLRGYQMTDSSGLVQFTTIHPGWYSGRWRRT
jgi:protocatechuate 3,4-dioxygenase beta subunit